MTEPTETTTETAEAPVETPDDASEPISLEAARKLRSEAAGLRARAKAAEDAYEGALARAANIEQGIVREYAADVLHDPDDLLKAQSDTSAYWDSEFGGITRSRVVEAAKAIAADRPWLLKSSAPAPPPSDRPLEGLRSGARPEEKTPEPTWSQALRGR